MVFGIRVILVAGYHSYILQLHFFIPLGIFSVVTY
jgi:hypothetical protein